MKKFFMITLLMGIGISVWAHDVKIETVNKDVVIENPKKDKSNDEDKKQKEQMIVKTIKEKLPKLTYENIAKKLSNDQKNVEPGKTIKKGKKETIEITGEVNVKEPIEKGQLDKGKIKDKTAYFPKSSCTVSIGPDNYTMKVSWKRIKDNVKSQNIKNSVVPESFSFTKIEEEKNTQENLANAKNAAIAKLDELANQHGLSEKVTNKIKTVVSEAKNKINNANDEKAINNIINKCKSDVDRIIDAEAAAHKQENKPEQAPAPIVQQPDLRQANEVANNFKSALSSYATKRTSADKSKLESMFVDKNAEVEVSNLTAPTKKEKVGQYLANLKAKNANEMNITLKEPEVRNNGNEVVYPYAQQFASDSYRDHTDKIMHLKKVGETYKITKIDVVRTSEYK